MQEGESWEIVVPPQLGYEGRKHGTISFAAATSESYELLTCLRAYCCMMMLNCVLRVRQWRYNSRVACFEV